jgi:rhamnogalacturonan acetylesterase
MNCLTCFELTTALLLAPAAFAQSAPPQVGPTQHPALFLVGDSIVKTGDGNGEKGPWGNLGGRSSRGYIEEGGWAKILDRLQPADYVFIRFGHNDAANSQNYPDRMTLKGNGDETTETEWPVTHNKETIHTYGWYLRQYVQETKAKGATPIVCSPVPRNTWIDGKIKRGFDGYATWAAAASRQSGAQFIDLNTLTADRYDALDRENAASYFNDAQHTTKAGAQLNAAALVEGLKSLDCPLSNFLVAANLARAATGLV